jgi:hypothetical protein
LIQNPSAHEQFILSAVNTNQTALDDIFGNGNYIFTVVAANSNQQVTVNLPSTLAQPGPPQLTSYTAAQSVNPAQAFTLTWDAFAGGTAKDYVYVVVGTAFGTSTPGTSTALKGTATSVEIPAGALQPNSTYSSSVSFYHLISTTNNSGYLKTALRSSLTQFSLITTGNAVTPLTLTNASLSGHTFSFDANSAADQSLTIQYNTNDALSPSQWQTLLTTNSATGILQVEIPVNTNNSHIFYRVKSGP